MSILLLYFGIIAILIPSIIIFYFSLIKIKLI
uniref:Cytochrome b6-f complex subunit 6 n=1 Tax=Callipsygma wilsonis TaxID=2320807 RepID=A0A386B031_9CHLO|nr:cytochrome b6-f complex subunit 6 [Callipsygma wilsonis]AYC65050.1 cytochrome b6-f complex subunit 6 [Callipsygma wilsonis]